MVSIRVASAPSVMRTVTTCPSSASPARATAGAATKTAPGLRALPPGESWTARVGGGASGVPGLLLAVREEERQPGRGEGAQRRAEVLGKGEHRTSTCPPGSWCQGSRGVA